MLCKEKSIHIIYEPFNHAVSEMKEIGQTYMYFNFIFGGQIWYENSCLDFSLHAVLNWWAWQFRHVHVHVYLHLAFFQKNCKCIGMILIISTHCNKNIYKILSTNFVKNIFLNGFIMGIGKRSLQDFYTLPLGCDSTTRILVPLSSDWLRQVSYFKT